MILQWSPLFLIAVRRSTPLRDISLTLHSIVLPNPFLPLFVRSLFCPLVLLVYDVRFIRYARLLVCSTMTVGSVYLAFVHTVPGSPTVEINDDSVE
jgi:hypothetical protein